MTVTKATAKHIAEYQGETFYFCSAGCRTKFMAAPEKYLPRAAMAETATPHDHAAHAHHDHSYHEQHQHHPEAMFPATVKDPVCGMDVNPATAKQFARSMLE